MHRDAQALTSIRAWMIQDYWRSHPFIPLWAAAFSASKIPAQYHMLITAERQHLQRSMPTDCGGSSECKVFSYRKGM